MEKQNRRALADTIPVLGGYVVLGMGFGIVMVSSGFSALAAIAMSVFIYAGSMQYVGVGLMTAGSSLVSIAVTTLMVNARHILYGISMLKDYAKTGRKKPYLIFALTDETYSLVCRNGADTGYCLRVSLLDHLWWVSGTAIGALLGGILPFSTEGIDFALTALFVTVFTQQWLETKNHYAALTGLCVSIVSLLIFGSGTFLIPAMLGTACALFVGRKVKAID